MRSSGRLYSGLSPQFNSIQFNPSRVPSLLCMLLVALAAAPLAAALLSLPPLVADGRERLEEAEFPEGRGPREDELGEPDGDGAAPLEGV